jgi:hypothetical protein
MTRAEWTKVVARYERSGLSAKAFAAREGISARSLSWWKWKLETDAELEAEETAPSGSASTAMSFLELRASHSVTTSASFEVVLAASGHVLRVPSGADLEEMSRLVDALEGALR